MSSLRKGTDIGEARPTELNDITRLFNHRLGKALTFQTLEGAREGICQFSKTADLDSLDQQVSDYREAGG